MVLLVSYLVYKTITLNAIFSTKKQLFGYQGNGYQLKLRPQTTIHDCISKSNVSTGKGVECTFELNFRLLESEEGQINARIVTVG